MNQSAIFLALAIVAGLQAKHWLCDGPLQTLAMVRAKGHYGQLLGMSHGLIHAVGTLFVLLFAGVDPKLSLALALAEGAVHYHIDFAKENVVRHSGWTTADGPFWWALTADQTLHHFTYVVLVWFAVTI